MGQPEEPAIPLREDDLECAICMSLLTDPFVTPCGHTFCHTCLSTHLQTGTTCPTCSSTISKTAVYPNFLLSKVSPRPARLAPNYSFFDV
jgi:E3 ubiquitin-protein ligase RFWD2